MTKHFSLPAKSQAWLDYSLKCKGYFHYFAVSFEGDLYPMGKWDAPFYTAEEAFLFKEELQKQFPDKTFLRVEGAICASMAVKNKDENKYWNAWIKKHLERVATLEKNGDSND